MYLFVNGGDALLLLTEANSTICVHYNFFHSMLVLIFCLCFSSKAAKLLNAKSLSLTHISLIATVLVRDSIPVQIS
jgi:NADH:ubiquinone oxidoreductase subunit 6 (subunit J)